MVYCRCVYGHKPGKFDATRASVLTNLAEMLVRQLEKKWVDEQVYTLFRTVITGVTVL